MCPPFLSLVHQLVQTRAGPMHGCHSLCEFMCVGYVDLEGLVFFVVFFYPHCLPSPLTLTLSLPPVSQGSLRPEGRNLIR